MGSTSHVVGRNDEYTEFTEMGESGDFTLSAHTQTGAFRIAFGPSKPDPDTLSCHMFGGYGDTNGSVGRLSDSGKVWLRGSAIFAATKVD